MPTYDPMINMLSGGKVSKQEFYDELPNGGIPVEDDSLLKVYPRPHLLEFLDGARALGYDLALCTTATERYIDVVLPLCGVSLDRFVAVICREKLTPRGGGKYKSIDPFIALGYSANHIVVIDDSRDVYLQTHHVIQIYPYHVSDKRCAKDSELLVMLRRLSHLGDQSLIDVREHYYLHSSREAHIRDLALTAFDSKKYRDLPYCPEIFGKVCVDIERYPEVTLPIAISLDRFLMFKDHGLVGGAEKQGNELRIVNYCPEVWTNVSAGISSMKLTPCHLDQILWSADRIKLQEMCHFLGYKVSQDDVLTLAAVSLQPINYNGLHVLALREGLLDDDLDLFAP
ncbi:HAD family hydrolase [Gilvimarinus agarilyticus]|nr:HAD family hydrolase [Gilvimarinus agarilyticus]